MLRLKSRGYTWFVMIKLEWMAIHFGETVFLIKEVKASVSAIAVVIAKNRNRFSLFTRNKNGFGFENHMLPTTDSCATVQLHVCNWIYTY